MGLLFRCLPKCPRINRGTTAGLWPVVLTALPFSTMMMWNTTAVVIDGNSDTEQTFQNDRSSSYILAFDGREMALLLSLPIIVSFLLLAAHFLRALNFLLVCLSLILPCLLFIRRRWVARLIQAALICAALEWIRTAISIGHERIAAGEPYLRTVLILGAVIVLTLGSAFTFYSSAMSKRYKLKA